MTAQIASPVDTYPDNASDRSPFGTSILYELYPQFKHLAAILGDLKFTLTGRVFLNIHTSLHPTVPSWSYLESYASGLPT
jgi:triacylglycerol lipase